MAATFRQGVSTTANLGSGASPTLAFTTEATLAGSLLVAHFQVFPQSSVLNSVTDSQSNTWVVLPGTNLGGGNYTGYLAYALNTAGGTIPTVTFHLGGSGTNNIACLAEFTGVNTFRAHDTPNTGVSTTQNSGNVTASAGDLLISYLNATGTTATVTPGTGFTIAESGGLSAGTVFATMMYDLSASAGSQDATSSTGAVVLTYAFGLAAFYQTGGGAGAGTTLTSGASTPATVCNSSGFAQLITSPTIGTKLSQPVPVVFCDPNGNEYAITGSTKGAQLGSAMPVVLVTPFGKAIAPTYTLTSNGASMVVTATLTGTKRGQPVPVCISDAAGHAYLTTGFSTFNAYVANPTPICLTDQNGNTLTLTIGN